MIIPNKDTLGITETVGMPTIGRAVTATDFIFNANTRISASVYGGTAGKTIKVWLEIQEI